MENYDELLDDIRQTDSRIKELQDVSLAQYAHAVDEILAGRLTDEKQIKMIDERLIDRGDDVRFWELSKKLIPYICRHYPQLVQGGFGARYWMSCADESEGSNEP